MRKNLNKALIVQDYVTLAHKQIKNNIEQSFSQVLLLAALLVLVTGLSLSSPFFMTWANFRNILDQTSLHIILALGMTFVICTGGIDLSVGAVAALSGVSIAYAMKSGVSVYPAVLLGLFTGVLIGAGNGLLISRLRINPFIITLGSMSVSRGLALIITGGIPIYGFDRSFTWWGSGHIGPVNSPIIMAGLLVAAGAFVLNMTRLGYYTLALGGNEEALRRTGASTVFYKTMVYALCGLTAALAGLISTARLNTAEPLAGWMFELDAIAAVVLGGTSMNGGKGTVAGTVIACFLLGVLRNGLTILSIPSYYHQLLIGIIILTSVVISEIRSQK
ncbi:ABC transporter permease [Candidatus Contubernalis alkaliaceticus]|uniref:ABC transporter permease n=1 Tax=Candidatus Contubernalis alkaliaceticus TaxID=338645 RepID=UPI001F4BD812|nr:ABC transporter permease [Candidatus Contubernalis alkalaceticus]UNC90867.1 ABC transporter permease [Candidatus Contubernalis alkalaceticus]